MVISSSSSSRYTKWKTGGNSLKASLKEALSWLKLLQTLIKCISALCFTLIINNSNNFISYCTPPHIHAIFKIIGRCCADNNLCFIQLCKSQQLQQSHMGMRVLSALLLFTLVVSQNVTMLMIDAIQPCAIYFTFDAASSQSLLTNCTYMVPGANITYTDWATCYATCCPGLVAPVNSSLNDIQTCVNNYAGTPFLVTLIGIMLGLFILFIFLVIPCCCSKDGVYYQIKKTITQKLAEEEAEEGESGQIKDSIKSKEEEMKIVFAHAPGSQHIISEVPHRVAISDQKIDDFPSEERKCWSCKQGKSNLKLKCSHHFHNSCLNSKSKQLTRCEECSSDSIYPVAAYCSICERRFTELHYISLENTYICKVCEEK